ncbi:MAG: hypothetical protein EOO54_10270 [Haliea sp.]|nr:MAG: hypothetical protein EOO54_10270 [Haliea sp.]
MATSSLLGGTQMNTPPGGKDTDALGPSDNSDSGSDAQGAYGDGELASDSDAVGTGRDRQDADILPDHVETLGDDDGEDETSVNAGGDALDDAVHVDDLAADDDADDEDPDAEDESA